LYRTKEFFREQKLKLIIPSENELKARTEAVLNSIYLLFNEGYNSTHAEELIRKDLVDEAMMLCGLLTENKHTQQPETFALMALMCFHASRFESRLTTEGEIILLPYQDRSKWDHKLIEQGNEYMERAAFGNSITTYHLEAAIAFEHCTAESFDKTNWARILELYDWLCNISSSPITELNRTVAILQVHGAAQALAALNNIEDKRKLEAFYLYHSLSGEIYSRLHESIKAKQSFENAMRLTQSATEKKFIRDKIIALQN